MVPRGSITRFTRSLLACVALAALLAISSCDTQTNPSPTIAYNNRTSDGQHVPRPTPATSATTPVKLKARTRSKPLKSIGVFDLMGPSDHLEKLDRVASIYMSSELAAETARTFSVSCLGGAQVRLWLTPSSPSLFTRLVDGNPNVRLEVGLSEDRLVGELLFILNMSIEAKRSSEYAEAKQLTALGSLGRDEYAALFAKPAFRAYQTCVKSINVAIASGKWKEASKLTPTELTSVNCFALAFDTPILGKSRSQTFMGQLRVEWDTTHFHTWATAQLSKLSPDSTISDVITPVEHSEMWFRPIRNQRVIWRDIASFLTETNKLRLGVWDATAPIGFRRNLLTIEQGTPSLAPDLADGTERIRRFSHFLLLAEPTQVRVVSHYSITFQFEASDGRVLEGYIGTGNDVVFLVPDWIIPSGFTIRSAERGRVCDVDSGSAFTTLGPPTLRPIPGGPRVESHVVDWLPTEEAEAQGVRRASLSSGKWPPISAPRLAVIATLPTKSLPGLLEEIDLARAMANGITRPNPSPARKTLPLVPMLPPKRAEKIDDTPPVDE